MMVHQVSAPAWIKDSEPPLATTQSDAAKAQALSASAPTETGVSAAEMPAEQRLQPNHDMTPLPWWNHPAMFGRDMNRRRSATKAFCRSSKVDGSFSPAHSRPNQKSLQGAKQSLTKRKSSRSGPQKPLPDIQPIYPGELSTIEQHLPAQIPRTANPVQTELCEPEPTASIARQASAQPPGTVASVEVTLSSDPLKGASAQAGLTESSERPHPTERFEPPVLTTSAERTIETATADHLTLQSDLVAEASGRTQAAVQAQQAAFIESPVLPASADPHTSAAPTEQWEQAFEGPSSASKHTVPTHCPDEHSSEPVVTPVPTHLTAFEQPSASRKATPEKLKTMGLKRSAVDAPVRPVKRHKSEADVTAAISPVSHDVMEVDDISAKFADAVALNPHVIVRNTTEFELLAPDSRPATANTGGSGRRAIHDPEGDRAYAAQMLAWCEKRETKAGTRGRRQADRIATLLRVARPATCADALYLTTEEAKEHTSCGRFWKGIIVTEGQQALPLQRIGDFLGEYYDDDMKASIQDAGAKTGANQPNVRAVTMKKIKERFAKDVPDPEPWNLLELATHCDDGLRPLFLNNEDCRLLTKLKVPDIGEARRRAYEPGYKEVEKWALLAQAGSLTEPHQDSHGYSTFITINVGNVGFGFLSHPTAAERRAWNANPFHYIGGKWRYVVLKPGQTVYFPAGTVHFVFRSKGGGNTLAFGGHVLRCSTLVHWAKTLIDECYSTNISNEDLTESAPGYLMRVEKFVRQARATGHAAKWGGEADIEEFLRLKAEFFKIKDGAAKPAPRQHKNSRAAAKMAAKNVEGEDAEKVRAATMVVKLKMPNLSV